MCIAYYSLMFSVSVEVGAAGEEGHGREPRGAGAGPAAPRPGRQGRHGHSRLSPAGEQWQ